jgi:DNA-binding response OmpR family regulator
MENIQPQQAAAEGALKILVIEDDKFLRELLVGKLAAEGHQLTIATDGKEAIAALDQPLPDLVLLDLLLPDLSGFQILEQMKARAAWKPVPVIVLSNLDQKEDLEKAKALGAVDFMIKANFSLNEIIARIKKVVPPRN